MKIADRYDVTITRNVSVTLKFSSVTYRRVIELLKAEQFVFFEVETKKGRSEMGKELNVRPLRYRGEIVINGAGRVVLDDEWIYVETSEGRKALNVNRAKYCQKIYGSQITIQSVIGENKLMDDELKLFVHEVSDKIVFEKFGKWYGVETYKKTRRTYGLRRVSLYKWQNAPNREFDGIKAFDLAVSWRSAFYI